MKDYYSTLINQFKDNPGRFKTLIKETKDQRKKEALDDEEDNLQQIEEATDPGCLGTTPPGPSLRTTCKQELTIKGEAPKQLTSTPTYEPVAAKPKDQVQVPREEYEQFLIYMQLKNTYDKCI